MLTIDIGINSKMLHRVRAQRIKGNQHGVEPCVYKVMQPVLDGRGINKGWQEIGTIEHKHKDGALVLSLKLLKFVHRLENMAVEGEHDGKTEDDKAPRDGAGADKRDSVAHPVGNDSIE